MNIIDELTEPLAQIASVIERIAFRDLLSAPMVGPDFNIMLPFATSAIYFIVSESRGLLYIGRATDVRQRWRADRKYYDLSLINWDGTHHRLREALDLGDCKLHWLPTPKHFLGVLEGLFIHHHNPPWNGQGVKRVLDRAEK